MSVFVPEKQAQASALSLLVAQRVREYFKDEAHREPQYGMLEEQVEAQKVNRLVLPCILLFWVILYIGLQ